MSLKLFLWRKTYLQLIVFFVFIRFHYYSAISISATWFVAICFSYQAQSSSIISFDCQMEQPLNFCLHSYPAVILVMATRIGFHSRHAIHGYYARVKAVLGRFLNGTHLIKYAFLITVSPSTTPTVFCFERLICLSISYDEIWIERNYLPHL